MASNTIMAPLPTLSWHQSIYPGNLSSLIATREKKKTMQSVIATLTVFVTTTESYLESLQAQGVLAWNKD